MNKIYRVHEINDYIASIIDKNSGLTNITISGEVSNLKKYSNGHYYLTIKDDISELQAVMFNYYTQNLDFDLHVGMKVEAKGDIRVYVARGSYNLRIKHLQLAGLGDLHQQLAVLKQKLDQLGWFDPNIKKPIPQFPSNIGVVTAATGAAIQDIIKSFQMRYPIANIYLFPSLVQGINAKFDIKKNIELANNFNPQLDVLIVGRGGGSSEDLWAFNEYEVLEAIHHSQIPVISAVGHQTDTLLSDFVADASALTPTASASKACVDLNTVLENVIQWRSQLTKLTKQIYNTTANEYLRLKNNYHLKHPEQIYKHLSDILATQKTYFQQFFTNKQAALQNQKNRLADFKMTLTTKFSSIMQKNQYLLDEYNQKLKRWVQSYFNQLDNQMIHCTQLGDKISETMQRLIASKLQMIQTYQEKLSILSPLSTIDRGYSIIYDENSKIVKSINQLQSGQIIQAHMRDGLINAKVQSKKAIKKKETKYE